MSRIRSAGDMASSVAHTLQRREKPSGESPIKWIVSGSIVGAILIAVLGFALFWHFRRRERDRLEHHKDAQELDDYGMGDYSSNSQRGYDRRGSDDPEVTPWPQRGQSSKVAGGPLGGAGATIERPQQQPQGQQQQQQQQPATQASLV